MRDVAAEFHMPPEDARHAIGFAAALDRIVANTDGTARQLLLSGHPRLPARVVMQIARTHADRQRFALAQVRADRNPLGKPPPGVDPPFDTHGPAEVLCRLPRNAGAVDWVADGLRDTPPARWPAADKLAAIVEKATAVRRHVRAMKRVVAGPP